MSIRERVFNFYIVTLIVGFLLINTVPLALGLRDFNFSIVYRIFVVLYGTVVILMNLSSLSRNNLYYARSFLVFWLTYLGFMLYDLFLKNISLYAGTSASDYYEVAIGSVFVPCLALLSINTKYFSPRYVFKHTYFLLYFSLFLAIFFRQTVVGDVVGRNSGGMTIGILLYGQYGTMMSLLSFFALSYFDTSKYHKIFYLSGFVLGFITIFISASRSPFLALLGCIIIFSFLKNRGQGVVFLGILVGLLSVFFMDIMILLNSYFESPFLDRLLNAVHTENTRIGIYKHAFNEFLDNPLFGDAFLIQASPARGSYPHNLILEVLMAMGVFGFVVFLLLFRNIVRYSLNVMKSELAYSWVFLIVMQFLIFAMFSSNIYSNNLLWTFVCLLILTRVKIESIKK